MRSRAMLAMLACLTVLSLGLPTGSAATKTKAVAKKDAVSVAKSYVAQHRRELGLKPADIADLAVTDTYRSVASGVTHVYLRQRYAGIDVLGAGMTANVKDGRVIYAPSRFIRGIDRKVSGIPTRHSSDRGERCSQGARPYGRRSGPTDLGQARVPARERSLHQTRLEP